MLALPCELVLELSYWISAVDLGSLRLVCKDLAETLRPQVFRDLRIDLQPERVDKDLEKLEKLAQGYPFASQCIRHLYIGWINPRLHGEYQGGAESRTVHIWNGLEAHLFKSLQSLQGLKSASLHPVLDDEWQADWGSRLVQTALSIPGLKTFSFTVTSGIVAHPFPRKLPSLHSLDVVFELESSDSIGDMVSELRRLVDTSPSLSKLSISRRMYGDKWNFPTDEGANILSHLDSRILTVQELSICNVPFPIARSIQHFCHLNSLTLEYSDWKAWGVPWERPPESMVAGTFLDDSSDRKELWQTLRGEQIWLSTIVVDHACPDFLQYLESYSLLQHLTVGRGDYQTSLASDTAARRFYQDSLPHHTSSLLSLHVHPEFEGDWAFSLDNWRTIQQCNRLVDLSLVINLDKHYPDSRKMDLTTVLDLSSSLTMLKRLSLNDAHPQWFRTTICALGYDFQMNPLHLHVEASSYYCTPTRPTQLPELTVSDRYYYQPVVKKDESGSSVAYYIVVSQYPIHPIPCDEVDSDSD